METVQVRRKENLLLRVMSFNVRYNNPEDGRNAWPHRKEMVASMVRFHSADLVGTQEPRRDQILDLERLLPGYGWIGIGREDGESAGEHNAIFYRKDRLDLLDRNTFWLSETPETPSRGWGGYYRLATWGKFKDAKTGKTLFLFNTHLDHRSEEARIEGAGLLLNRIHDIAGNAPLLLTGDFNSRPADPAYRILTGGENGKEKLTDARHVSAYPHHGPAGTWSGFEEAAVSRPEPIDYIFIKNAVQVIQHGVLADSFNGRFPSDHLPVLAEVVIE